MSSYIHRPFFHLHSSRYPPAGKVKTKTKTSGALIIIIIIIIIIITGITTMMMILHTYIHNSIYFGL